MRNINFEDLPKHEVSQRSLRKLEQVMFAQDDFGIQKYGVPLSHSHKYDWLQMFLEEIADGIKYIQCEIDRKDYIIQMLQAGLRANDPKEYIEIALNLLTVKGTGK
ncbi:hypothetical protein [Cytobacillus purgationiresistens]|uniref:Uncharacterized protein n=1 Tax=Cytobacillus purgationiresistens TaxID=863449 RepID=A0ABU0ACE3_9BACI|nr:hypothetical protein [Cytobacillus purgationiresistens]MDQ0268907.1 hypothetical protein [Cytobacillus purgationiresistens]